MLHRQISTRRVHALKHAYERHMDRADEAYEAEDYPASFDFHVQRAHRIESWLAQAGEPTMLLCSDWPACCARPVRPQVHYPYPA